MDPYTPHDRVLAYLTDADLSGGDPTAVLDRPIAMSLDGHLGVPGRTVRPYLFLGRTTDRRLAYLCAVQPAPRPAGVPG